MVSNPSPTPTASRAKFLWINKSADSKRLSNSRDSRDLLYAIHSHVRPRLRGGKRKLDDTESSNPAKRIAPSSWECTAEGLKANSVSDSSSDAALDEAEADEVEEIVNPNLSTQTHRQHVASDIEQEQNLRVWSCNTVPGNVVDPFNCMACKLDKASFSVLQYHLHYSRFYLFRNEAVLHQDAYKKHQSSSFIRNLFLGALQHSMHLDSLTAATATRMLTLFPNNKSIRSVAQRSMQSAVRQLRSHFSSVKPDGVTDAKIIMDVLMLCMADWFRGDLDAARVHLKPMKHLVTHLAGEELDPILLDLICTIDLFVASEMVTRPCLSQCWHPEPPPREKVMLMLDRLSHPRKRAKSVFDLDVILTPEERLRSPIGHLDHLKRPMTEEEARYLGPGLTGIEQRTAIGFAEAVAEGVLTDHINQVMQTYLPYCAIHTHIWLDGHPTNAEINWINQSCKTIVYRLLETETPSEDASVSAWLSECARLTLIMFTNYGPNPMAWRATQKIMPHLKTAIEGYERACTSRMPSIFGGWQPTPLIETRLVLWSLIGGVFASHEHPNEHEWFIARAAKTAEYLGIRNYLQLHLSMGHFGHCDTLHLAALSTVLERIAQTKTRHKAFMKDDIRPYLI